jgi:hypothetical protein
MPKLSLSDVSICAADAVNIPLTARALCLSIAACDFGDAMLFAPDTVEGPFRTVKVQPFATRGEYGGFILNKLAEHVHTPFALIVQWDGYVLDPTSWVSEFRAYDYIGAKWPWHQDTFRVGNGGFSLRSRRLLEVLALPRFCLPPETNEDDFVCRQQRSVLEQEYGIAFAPEATADRFAYERSMPDRPSFGFHGLFNMWRHVEDREMAELVPLFAPYLIGSREYLELLIQYFLSRKFIPLTALYRRLRSQHGLAEVRGWLLGLFGDQRLIAECLFACEALLRPPSDVPAPIEQTINAESGLTRS